jgi:tripartite-type tricarboxylate transporter receptor subunit TctC
MLRRLAALLFALATCQAFAQAYPTHSIQLIVPFAAGGGADVAARVLASALGAQLGQTVVVENVTGAGGTIGTAKVAHATPDGYTLLLGTPSTHGTNVAVYQHLDYDAVKDFAPVMLIGTSPFMLLTSPKTDVKSVKDLIADAKAHPGKINFASYGNGSINHLVAELFNSMAGIDVAHVPYRGSAPAMSDLIAGRVQFTFDGPAALGQVRGHTVNLIAVTSKSRWSVFPDVPTVAESGLPGFEAITWFGLFAPAGTPKAVLDLLNAKANAAIHTPPATEGFGKLSIDVAGGAPDVLAKQVRHEIDTWVDVARKRNIKLMN